MINVLDIETYEKNNIVIPYCICMILSEKKYHVYNEDNIIINLLNKIVNFSNKDYIEIYVHNLNFDGFIVIGYLSKNFIKFEMISEKTNIYSIKIFYCNKKIVLKCSYKIIPLSLRKLGEIEKFNKSFFPYKFVNDCNLEYIGQIPPKNFWENDDYENYTKDKNIAKFVYDLKKETIEYCYNDVVLTQKIINKIFDIIDLESKKIRKNSLSSPAISHKIFFSKYNNLNINENLRLDYDSYIRNSFFGGRCEVFGNIRSNEYVKYYDFSGMYGQCMLEKFHLGDFKYEKINIISKPGFYNINYKSDINFLPVLPAHFNNKLIFANGEKNGTFWFEEINLFEKMGGIVTSINSAIVYEKFDYVFKEFVNKFNQIREKEGYYKIFAKLMINSLYGSMALKYKESIQYITFSEKEFYNIHKNTNIENFYRINNCYIIVIKNDYKSKIFFKNEIKENSKRNVSYSSAIAAKARIKLYNALLDVISDGGRILYCDTDSIFAAYDLSNKNKETKTFKWIETYTDAVFIAPKTYALRNDLDTIKIKGVNTKKISFDDLKKKFYKDENILFDDQLNFRKSDFSLKQFYTFKNIILTAYDKRKFVDHKKNTIPLQL